MTLKKTLLIMILYKNAWVDERPPHLFRELSKQECSDLLRNGGLFIRNAYDFDCQRPTSFWYIIKDSFEGRSELSKKTNKYIDKANDKFIIRKITHTEFYEGAYEVFLSAFKNYKIKSERIPSKQSFIDSNNINESNIDIWGAIDKDTGKLAAYSIVKLYENVAEFISSKGNPNYFTKYYPMYGLYYARNEYYLGKCGFQYVISSARSLTQHSNIQDFLIDKFKFRKAYCKLQVEYTLIIKVAIYILYPITILR